MRGGVAMDEGTTRDPSSLPTQGEPKLQQSPVHESRLAALRRAETQDNDIVLQGGYTATSGRTSPTQLLQRSNSIRTQAAQAAGSPSSSGRSDLSPHPRSPRPSTPEALEPSRERASPPRFRSTSGQFTRSGSSFSRKGRWRVLLKRSGTFCFLLLFVCFAMDWWYLSTFHQPFAPPLKSSQADTVREDGVEDQSSAVMYDRLLALAAHGLAEKELKPEPDDLWEEPTQNDTTWLPCANQRPKEHISPPLPEDSTGYIMINANGGLSQQRVAICNAVAVARLLNATLVLPKFTFSSELRDSSQFKDLYVEDYFIDYLKDDVLVVKELPFELQTLDFDALEAVVTENDVPKEAEPSFYLKHILPLLLNTRVVLFEGFGNRLAFDSVPSDIQTLRCRCNFHALRFIPALQRIGNLITERMRDKHTRWGPRDDEFELDAKPRIRFAKNVPKYLAMHMGMAANNSLCETQSADLRAYVEEYSPLLANLEHDEKLRLSELQEELGACPLMPEEGFLILAALGYKRATRIYLAGSARLGTLKMATLKFLYPNLVTKEDILTVEELQPFRNHSSQMAVLDYLACSSADMFVMTDARSELSLLVAGHRIYHSSGHAPTLRPSKKSLAALFDSNATIEWRRFEEEVRKSVEQTKRIVVRPFAHTSIYRHPRCLECMCAHHV